MKRKLLFTGLITSIVIFTGLAIYGAIHNTEVIRSKNIQIESKSFKLQKLETEFKNLNSDYEKEVENKTLNAEKEQEYQKHIQELEQRYKELEVSKAKEKAEQDRLAKASTKIANAVVPKASASSAITGNKHDWLRASGIPESEWWAVDSIVSRESGWKPCAYNPGRNDCNANPTSACGLAQSLPCGKQAKYGHWTDPVANLKWQHEYVTARYGGYPQAVAFWNSNHWY